ncbi:hypothetical protein [Caudoviricetes sp.]|nr:hypothetical protein [Caudoviricetes sp.]
MSAGRTYYIPASPHDFLVLVKLLLEHRAALAAQLYDQELLGRLQGVAVRLQQSLDEGR